MPASFTIALVSCLLAPVAATGAARLQSEARPIRVLFVGNSYTYFNNLPGLVAGLTASTNKAPALQAEMVAWGGASLRQHWEAGLAAASIRRGRFDYVVLQEQSLLPLDDPGPMEKYARLFDAEIRNAGARTVFFLTWARQQRPQTQAALAEAYLRIAGELQALVAPVGVAWQGAVKRKPRQPLFMMDGSHPGPAGSYLAACVFYSVFYSTSPEGLAPRVVGRLVRTDGSLGEQEVELANLSLRDAVLLQRVAWQTVRELNVGRE